MYLKISPALGMILALGLLAVFPTPTQADGHMNTDENEAMDKDNTLYMDIKGGRVVIRMRPDLAPKHVARIKELVREGFYDGLTFHRVIPGFVAQGGDPLGNGTGGSGVNIPAEFSQAKHKRGTVAMARSQNPNSADSQFYIAYADLPSLDGQYTIWGEVTKGMHLVDRIRPGEGANGTVLSKPTIIERMQVAADVDKGTGATGVDATP